MAKRKKLQKNNFPYLLFILGLTLILFFILFLLQKSAPQITKAQTEGKLFYPTQYSDNHITENAKISDARFKDLVVLHPENNLANVISAVEKSEGGMASEGQENGTWLWTPILEITPKYQHEIISGAQKKGIKEIYVSLDSYLDIYAMSDTVEKEKKQKEFDTVVENFIEEAHQNGISVDAEGGWRNWAEPGHVYKALAIVDYAIEFNKTHSEKFRGIQYDIEPYALDTYDTDPISHLGNLVTLISETVAHLDKTDLLMSMAIPDFYDGLNNTPLFQYAGKTQSMYSHLLGVLDRRAGSQIIIMSYRNTALGNDGTIDISRYEIAKADTHTTKVIIAQETSDVTPRSITFFNKSNSEYQKQVHIIENTFSKDESFGGIATHYVNSFLVMK